MVDLKGRNGIIFGATGFFGNKLAIKLTEMGSNLILHGKSKNKLDILDDEIRKTNNKQILLHSNLLNKKFYDNLLNLVSSRFNKLDFIINVSSHFSRLSPITNYSHKEWNEMIEVNLNSYWRTLKELETLLLKSEKPKVIFLNNESIESGKPFFSGYSVASAAIKALSNIFFEENKRLKIQIKLFNIKMLNLGVTKLTGQKMEEQIVEGIIQKVVKKGFSDNSKKFFFQI